MARIPLFDPYFLALGSINPRKNSYALLKAFIECKDEGKVTSDLVFVGVLGKVGPERSDPLLQHVFDDRTYIIWGGF